MARLITARTDENTRFTDDEDIPRSKRKSLNRPASDISIAAKEILRWRQTINEILSEHSGKSIEQLEKDSDRDYYMSADEAKDYGLVDEVISKKPKE